MVKMNNSRDRVEMNVSELVTGMARGFSEDRFSIEIVQDIGKGDLLSAYMDSPFDKGRAALEAGGYRIISAQETARLRMQEGIKSALISLSGNWIREGVLYIPNKGIILTKKSPILTNAKEATDCHRNKRDLQPTSSQIEEALADSVKVSDNHIPTNRFADNEVTIYLFGNDAKAYGEYLRDAGTNKIPVFPSSLEEKQKPYARPLFFDGLYGDFGLSESSGLCKKELCYHVRVRGVKTA